MSDQFKDHFWRGPVQSQANAVRIIKATGWMFVIVGLGIALTVGLSPSPTNNGPLEALIAALLLCAPAAFLLNRKTRAPAIMLLVISGFFTATTLLLPVFAVMAGAGVGAIATLVPALIWLLLAMLAWRAIKAAGAIRRFNGEGRAVEAVVSTFD